MRAPLALSIWVAVLVASIWIVVRTPFTADLSAFLPRSPSVEQQMLVDQLREGVVSRLLLMAVEGEDAPVLAKLSRSLRERLMHTDAFAYVNNGAEDVLEVDGRFLLEHRYQLSESVNAQRFTEGGLRSAFESSLDMLASSASPLAAQLLGRDPTGAFMDLLDQLRMEKGPQKREGVWFSRDGKRALLIAQTRAAGFDLDAQARAIAAAHAAFAELGRGHSARLVMSGPGVFAVASRAAVKADASRLSTIALMLVATLLIAVYRSPRLLFYILLPVITGAAVGGAAVALGFGTIHGITLGFGVTLIGEAVDYAIYLFTHLGRGEDADAVMRRLWPMLRLGVLTSICGFGAMLFSGFPGLAQLAVFSVAGLIAAVLVTRWVLPALAAPHVRPGVVAALSAPVLGLSGAGRRLATPLLIATAIGALWLVWRGDALWDDDLAHLSPLSAADKLLDQSLRAELGAPDVRHLVIVRGASKQAVLVGAERLHDVLQSLQRAGALGGYDSPARFLPSAEAQQARQMAIPAPEVLSARVRDALVGLPYRPDAFAAFLREAAAARAAKPLQRADLNGTGLALKVDSLLIERRGEWFAMLPLIRVNDDAAVRRAIATGAPGAATVIDIKRESDALYRGYRVRAALFSALGAGFIVVLLGWHLRSLRRVFDVLAPLAGAVVLVMLAMHIAGVKLTLFHLVALLLVIGIGSNYSLFFERRNLQSIGDPRCTTAAVLLCNVSTAIGFGVLAWSSSPVLSAIGVTAAIGAVCSFLLAALLTSVPTTSSSNRSH